MTVLKIQERLNADELAFYFESESGVDAASLGKFLQRASTISKRSGAELRVVALRDGSLALVLRITKRYAVNAKKEFDDRPLATSASTSAMVALAYAAFTAAMDPEGTFAEPMAKAAAEIVETGDTATIKLVSSDSCTLIMDRKLAKRISKPIAVSLEQRAVTSATRPRTKKLVDMATRALDGMLTGKVFEVEGRLHFRPDGFSYLVPIEQPRALPEILVPLNRYTVRGEVLFYEGAPKLILVTSAKPT